MNIIQNVQIPPDDAHPDIKNFYEHWRSIFSGDRLPGRQHFDPLDVAKLLPRIMLIAIDRDPLSFQVRLAGSKIEEFAGESLKGKPFAHRLTGPDRQRAERGLRAVIEEKQPNWRRGKPLIQWEKNFMMLERIFLPLAENGEMVDMILTLTIHTEPTA